MYMFYFRSCEGKPTVKKNNNSCCRFLSCALKVGEHEVDHEQLKAK